MAGIKLTYKVKAAGVLEVIISMLVILIVFGIAMMVFVQVSVRAVTAKKLKAQALLNYMKIHYEPQMLADSQLFKVDGIVIKMDTSTYGAYLTQVDLYAYNEVNERIDSLKFIAYNGR